MKVTVLVVGRVGKRFAPIVSEYEARASRYWKLEVHEVSAAKSDRPDEVRRIESERLLSRIPERSRVFALTRRGEAWSSERLSEALGEVALRGGKDVTFLIGGAFGLADERIAGADHRISLSAMTLPHDLARLVLMEQLYRAGTLMRGEPYHKGR